jgi:hypothetical protein
MRQSELHAPPGSEVGRHPTGLLAAARMHLIRALLISETPQGFIFDWRQWQLRIIRFTGALSGSWWGPGFAIALYASIFLVALHTFPYSSSFGTVDEQLNYYQVAKNFNAYGFRATWFLHDLSTSPRPQEHPFVYNHMPPGPEIFTALLMHVVGERYEVIRLVFALIFLAGLVYYAKFVRILLARVGLVGWGLAPMLLTPWWVMRTMDHPAFSPFPLLAFLPMCLLDAHYHTGRRLPLYVAVLLAFIASIYLPYQNLFMLFTVWVMFSALDVLTFHWRHVALFLSAGALGIMTHLFQSVLLFGVHLTINETALALSNRMFGVPTYKDLMSYYRAIDLVHHGTHAFSVLRLAKAITGAVDMTVGIAAVAFVVMAIAFAGIARGTATTVRGELFIPRDAEMMVVLDRARIVLGLAVAGAMTVALPMLMFPAYSADYGLSGMNEYFVLLPVLVGCVFVISLLIRWRPREIRPDSFTPTVIAWFTVAIGVAAVVVPPAQMQARRLAAVSRQAVASNPHGSLLELQRRLEGKVVMTNVYPTTVGFFTREAAFGGCEKAVFREDGGTAPAECHAVFVRGYGRTTHVEPTHYVLFRELFTGFTLCLHECLDELYRHVARRHPIVYENALFTIFELRPTPPAHESTASPSSGSDRVGSELLPPKSQ